MQKDNILKIMVVDDNQRMRNIIKETLSGIPCTISEYSNGEDAVAAYDESLPDWILMDVVMEPMNGITALTEIRKNHPDAKVIMVTNSVEQEVSDASFKAGATAFVRKESLLMLPGLIMRQ